MARTGYLAPQDIQKTIEWLSTNSRETMSYYLLTAVLASLDPASPDIMAGQIRKTLAANQDLVAFMKKKLDVANTEWNEPGLKATILLKWTLFLTESRHQDPTLEHNDGFKTEQLETQIWNAVQGDAFTYLARSVMFLNRKRGKHISVSFLAPSIQGVEQEQAETPADDFKPFILDAFESLVRSLLTHAPSELRKIKQRQEDFLLASVRNDRSRTFRPGLSTSSAPSVGPEAERHPRNDVAMLLSFIGLLYSSLPAERALQFWGAAPHGLMSYLEQVEASLGKLPAFLHWAVWSTQARDVDMFTALYDMLSGLTKGQQCSELGYNFLAKGGGEVMPGSTIQSSGSSPSPSVSLPFIFGTLDAWASAGANQPPQPSSTSQYGWASQSTPPPHSRQHHLNLNEKDVRLAQAFLKLLSSITAHSVAVRIAISGNAQFRAIPTLISLIPLGIPLELKGAIFETLAAFCEPGAGSSGVEICKAVWSLMERLEVINVRVSGSSGIPMVRGVEVELEEVETAHKMYPATIPFLKLLSTLIHTPKRVSLKDRYMEEDSAQNIPETLGQPYRLPGIGPFVVFVVNNVFSTIPNRDYVRPTDRWLMNDLCLSFIERCLASYDLQSLVTPIEELQVKGDSILPLLIHPGYDIMKRILSTTPLQASLLAYIVEGIEGLDKGFAEEEYYFQTTLIRVLRIILRVLEIQDIFLDVLVPMLSDFSSTQFVGVVHPRSYFTRFDQALSFSPQYVPAVASYILYPQYPELALLSVKIMSSLASTTTITNLNALIERSAESDRILAGYQHMMDVEAWEDVVQAETVTEQNTGAGAADLEEPPEAIIQGTKLAILDLFIQNTHSGCAFPNVAHFLLLGSMTSDRQIQDPHALGAKRTCIHSILDALNAGIPEWKGRDRARYQQLDPLFVTLPGLAERCYKVVQQLCEHPKTSDFTMRYLRTRENFFVRHLAAIPFRVPSLLDYSYIQVRYKDESQVVTTVDALTAFLRLRSSVFSLVALELHVLTNKGHNKSVTELLELLFGNGDQYSDEDEDFEGDIFRPFQEVGQSHLRIIELLQSLDFDWSDSLDVHPIQLEFLQLNIQACTRMDECGCEVIDRVALFSLLAIARRVLHAQGRLVSPAQVERLKAETTYVLESCAVENHRRLVHHAVLISYQAWRHLLDMALMKCFDRLPHERRESMLFDLLHVLPTTLRSPNIQQQTAMLLSEVIVSSIAKLREDRQHQMIIQSTESDIDGGSLPSERLYTLLRGILECIMDSNRNQFVRGNLYAALINYLHLVSSAESPRHTHENLSLSEGFLSTSVSSDDFTFSDSQIGLSTRKASMSLITGTLSIMKNTLERLVGIIARDAIDGMEVWKTIAFMLLDSLVRLCRVEKQSIVLSALTRHGILSNFVQGLKESDLRLQGVVKPDPGWNSSFFSSDTVDSFVHCR
jgi:nuclear pore complex protein Nup205